ncbi:beta-lactamase family protein [Pontibacter qinzhouensis]|uniref:Beta-lactamase family protein n=1 Tax=Pontibacter qinzhouensis TaxID=2603253 RepID=A0A5C8IEP2_9BACT|nr:beta-lactamase family protein [Pontibacter qinzhouensis]
MAEKQKLSLQDSIQKFIPDFPSKGYTITVEHLLTHTSGLTEFFTLDHPDPFALRRDFKPMELIQFFMNEPLEFEPGTKSSYTNSGYFLLGYIIEVVSGVPYGAYLQENIFKPSGMTQTYYGDNSQVIPNRVSSYFKEGDSFRNGEYRSMTVPYAAGALLSTVEEMSKWHQSLYQNKLISRDLLTASITAYRLKDETVGDFGYGWFINPVEVQGSPTLLHPGGISGFSSLIMYLPKEDVLVVLLANFNEVKLEEIGTQAATLAMGKKLKDEVFVDKSIWETFKGKYQMTSDVSRVALIQELEGKLIIKVENSWGAELSPTNNTTFRVKNVKPSATLEFIKDEMGKVTKFVINQGALYEWVRIE